MNKCGATALLLVIVESRQAALSQCTGLFFFCKLGNGSVLIRVQALGNAIAIRSNIVLIAVRKAAHDIFF